MEIARALFWVGFVRFARRRAPRLDISMGRYIALGVSRFLITSEIGEPDLFRAFEVFDLFSASELFGVITIYRGSAIFITILGSFLSSSLCHFIFAFSDLPVTQPATYYCVNVTELYQTCGRTLLIWSF